MNAAEDNLLDDNDNKPVDIIAQGEKIADVLGKVKTMNVNVLASQLSQLSLTFEQKTIDDIKNVATCTAIEGVEVSPEELDALIEAANENANLANEADELKKDFEKMNIGKSESAKPDMVPPQKRGSMIQSLPPKSQPGSIVKDEP